MPAWLQHTCWLNTCCGQHWVGFVRPQGLSLAGDEWLLMTLRTVPTLKGLQSSYRHKVVHLPAEKTQKCKQFIPSMLKRHLNFSPHFSSPVTKPNPLSTWAEKVPPGHNKVCHRRQPACPAIVKQQSVHQPSLPMLMTSAQFWSQNWQFNLWTEEQGKNIGKEEVQVLLLAKKHDCTWKIQGNPWETIGTNANIQLGGWLWK